MVEPIGKGAVQEPLRQVGQRKRETVIANQCRCHWLGMTVLLFVYVSLYETDRNYSVVPEISHINDRLAA